MLQAVCQLFIWSLQTGTCRAVLLIPSEGDYHCARLFELLLTLHLSVLNSCTTYKQVWNKILFTKCCSFCLSYDIYKCQCILNSQCTVFLCIGFMTYDSNSLCVCVFSFLTCLEIYALLLLHS